MSIFRFNLTETHIKLLRQLNIISNSNGHPSIDEKQLFGNSEVYEDIDLILNGKTKDIGPDDIDSEDYSEEQMKEWDKLLEELTDALDIVLFTGKFEPGEYVRRTYQRNWIKTK